MAYGLQVSVSNLSATLLPVLCIPSVDNSHYHAQPIMLKHCVPYSLYHAQPHSMIISLIILKCKGKITSICYKEHGDLNSVLLEIEQVLEMSNC